MVEAGCYPIRNIYPSSNCAEVQQNQHDRAITGNILLTFSTWNWTHVHWTHRLAYATTGPWRWLPFRVAIFQEFPFLLTQSDYADLYSVKIEGQWQDCFIILFTVICISNRAMQVVFTYAGSLCLRPTRTTSLKDHSNMVAFHSFTGLVKKHQMTKR